MRLTHKLLATGVASAALVASGGAAFAGTPGTVLPTPTPRVVALYSGTTNVPLGDNGTSLSAYVYDGHLFVGGLVETAKAPSKVTVKDGAGKDLCVATDLTPGSGSFGWDCHVTVTDRVTSLTTTATVDGRESAPSKPIVVTNYSAAAAPATTKAAAATVGAPKVSLIERLGFTSVSILLEGKAAPGSEFVVSFGGRTQRIQSSSGSTFAIVNGTAIGKDNLITVTQEIDGVSSAPTTFTYRLG